MTTLLSSWPEEWERKCPHSRIEFCPLYIAAHEAGGLGCDDGRLAEGGCALHRGMNYGAALVLLDRSLVQECAERESQHMKIEQRRRNMKNLGLH